ncbi:MAG: amino acid ABC transporter substrate-binding protein [Devosia sp. 67-54]|uniref:amino acid ABC transporter substrate-binding protein n=1 Tax=unclassified Devosia TaxID=196773 RepID=UPI000960076F|nr:MULTISPECIES: amino acid ABC transporter substrate-binding protein [unclassified Devosia]MBN9304063.1 amino acid ABC transporter substrate-binding protein [Devosia sp.]OJX17904.1 MAG: amino acid ABC transporter substrate-binding protein [Devosia sp. 67-54]
MIKHVAALAVILAALSATSAYADRLADVKARGFLQCGVTEGVPGFSELSANNDWVGIEVDFCRAIASAVFNDPKAVRFTTTTSADRWQALSSGQIDVLARTSTWTMQRDTQLGVTFVGTLFYDGQAFMVKKDSGATTVHDLDKQTICIEDGTTTELNLADYFAINKLSYTPLSFPGHDETVKAFQDGKCMAYTSDSSGLAADRSKFTDPADYIILPEVISKEPLAVVVAKGDDGWFKVVRWVYYALLDADELGVTQKNIDEMVGSDNPEIKRLLGVSDDDFGTPVGLTKDWAYRVIKGVGNYGEMFDRNVGPNTPLGLQPGLNAIWKDGGIQYAPPIR